MKLPGLEKLRVVFSLDVGTRTGQTIGDRNFDVLVSQRIDALSIFSSIKDALNRFGRPGSFEERDGTVVTGEQVERRIQKSGRWIQGLQINGLATQVGQIAAMRQSFIIMEEQFKGAASSWDKWVSPFSGMPNFVQAWVTDVEYDYWQNASDPLEYTVAGRDMTGLKMKSNGLPPPLEQQMVDTSQNPGRWGFRQGHIEAIGSTMWFGENFWRLIGSNREDALASVNWLHLTRPRKGILRVSSDIRFDDETTASEQNALRAIIYGSGISSGN